MSKAKKNPDYEPSPREVRSALKTLERLNSQAACEVRIHQHADAFLDMESRICDAAHMATLANQAAIEARIVGGDDGGVARFAVFHLVDMVHKLKEDYYGNVARSKP